MINLKVEIMTQALQGTSVLAVGLAFIGMSFDLHRRRAGIARSFGGASLLVGVALLFLGCTPLVEAYRLDAGLALTGTGFGIVIMAIAILFLSAVYMVARAKVLRLFSKQ